MEDKLYNYLKKVYNDQLKENKLLRLFITTWSSLKTSYVETDQLKGADLYNIVNKLYEGYIPQTSLTKDESSLLFPDEQLNSANDYRCKYIFLTNTRGIGDYKNEQPYGISLLKDKAIQNAVIIGHNGSGKSSIFSAMEYIYCNDQIGEKLYRNYKESSIRYLENEITKKSSNVEISTPSGIFSLKNKISDIEEVSNTNPSVSFISEYDILINSQIEINDDSYTIEIARKLGFIDFTNFKTNLDAIIKYQFNRSTKSTDYKKAVDKLKTIEASINRITNEIETLSSKISSYTLDNYNNDFSKKINEIDELINKQINLPDINTIKKNGDEFIKFFEQLNLIKNNTQRTLESAKVDFLQHGLQFLEVEKNCPFCSDSRKDYQVIKTEVNETIISYKDYTKLNEEVKQYFENTVHKLIYLLDSLRIILEIFDTEIYFPVNEELNAHYKVLLNDVNTIIGIIPYDEILEELHSIKGNGFIENDRNKLLDLIQQFGENLFAESYYAEIRNKISSRDILLKEIKDGLLKKSAVRGYDEKITTELVLKQKRDEYDNLLKEKVTNEDKKNIGLRDLEIHSEIIKEAKILLEEVGAYIDSIVEDRIEPIKEVITNAMDDFLDDGMKLSISFKDVEYGESISKKLEIKLKYNNTEIDPKKYFNNARYKMFATSLAIGIALASRRNTNINLPLVMDDEFFDCDIIKRSEFEIFFSKIIELYFKFSPDMPFQFIIFTHDELIFESTAKAVENASCEIQRMIHDKKIESHEYWKNNLRDNTIFARLFDYKDSDSTVKIVNDNKYWDLTVEL